MTVPTARRLSRAGWVFTFACLAAVLGGAESASAQLRVVNWNTATGSSTALSQRGTYFDKVFEFMALENVNGIVRRPDVLVLQEQRISGGQNTSAQAFAARLNALYGVSTYQAWTHVPFASDGLPVGFVYDSAAVTVQAQASFKASGITRDTGRISLRPVGYDSDSDIFIYNSHFKASTGSSNEDKRAAQAITNRWSTATAQDGLPVGSDFLAEGTNIMYAGDFNQRSSFEDGFNDWPTLTENPYEIYRAGLAPFSPSTGHGQAVDPIGLPGTWNNNSSIAEHHTQSPHDGTQGLVTGGMDDRFDFVMLSHELFDGEGVSYIGDGVGDITGVVDSYRVFGNNGTSYNQAANYQFNTALPWVTGQDRIDLFNALAKASDHLPVITDYQLAAKMGVTVAPTPARVMQGSVATVDVTVENTAPVGLAVGADELDFVGTTSGDVAGGFADADAATGGGVVNQVTLDTNSTGAKTGSVMVNSNSQGAVDADFSQQLDWQVVEDRVITATAANLGTLIVGGTGQGATTMSTTGDNDHFTSVQLNAGSFGSGMSVTTSAQQFDDAGDSSAATVQGSFASAGAKAGDVLLTVGNGALTGEGLTGEAVNDISVPYTASVLDHSNASFDVATDQNALLLDLGIVVQGRSVPGVGYVVHNLETTAGFTAALDLDGVAPSGDSGVLGSGLPGSQSGIEAGANAAFTAAFDDTSTPGTYNAMYTLNVSDENLPGATVGTDLTLTLTGIVAILGDADLNFVLEATDIDLLYDAKDALSTANIHDIDNDGGPTDQDDVNLLVTGVLNTQFGDANLDGVINGLDLSALASNWQDTTGWAGGDFNGDDFVNGLDLSLLAANWQFVAGSFGGGGVTFNDAQVTGSLGGIPEPGSGVLLVLGAALLARRRRRSHAR